MRAKKVSRVVGFVFVVAAMGGIGAAAWGGEAEPAPKAPSVVVTPRRSASGSKVDPWTIVEVHDYGGGPPAEVRSIGPGQSLRFGRGGPDHDVELVLPDEGVSRLAGEIRAVEDHWVLTNLSADRTYVVDNPEGGGEYVTVAPRRIGAPVKSRLSTHTPLAGGSPPWSDDASWSRP